MSVLVVLTLFLEGCSTSFPISTPELKRLTPPEWALVEASPVMLSTAQYWALLDDPVIVNFVGRSIENNRDLVVATARIAQARAGVTAARAGYLPQVNTNGSVSRDVGDFAESDLRFSIGANVSWETNLFGRIGLDVAAKQEALRASKFALADLQRLIIGQVVQTTVSARAIAMQLDIARDTLTIQNENLQIAEWRLQAGLVSSLDVEQARAQRAQTAASIPALESDLVAAANAVSVLIGEVPGAAYAELAKVKAVPEPPAEFGIAAPAEVLRNRPDVRQAEANLLADGARLGLAKAQLLPLVRLTGNINSSSIGLDTLFDVITGGLFANISQLAFDGGGTQAQIDGAEAQVDVSLALWEQSILLALEDVESASVALSAARDQVTILVEARKATQNAALIARSQYTAGLIDFETLLTTESQLLAARNSVVAAEAERANAFVTLTQALGGGWIHDHDEQNREEPIIERNSQ